MTRCVLNGVLFGSWLWVVVMGTATVLLDRLEAPRPALQAISADGSRSGTTQGGVTPVPSSGTEVARTPAPRPSEHRQPAVTLDVARATRASRPAPLRGTASWYRQPGLVAAAGPALRGLAHWRGRFVEVCAERCVVVRIVDFCQCYRGERRERLLDLSDRAFAAIAPLVAGVVEVTVRPVAGPQPPATDR
jgi:rare lipoprotein A (peptidoglycan hydrolase)